MHPRLLARELFIACTVGVMVATTWVGLGNVGTWRCSWRGSLDPLTAGESALIAVPAFIMGWVFFLARRSALKSRARFTIAAFVTSAIGASIHRAAFLDEDRRAVAPADFLGAVEYTLDSVLRRVLALDISWLWPTERSTTVLGMDSTLVMDVSSVLVATLLAAAAYGFLHRKSGARVVRLQDIGNTSPCSSG